jgi:hypothetical protein
MEATCRRGRARPKDWADRYEGGHNPRYLSIYRVDLPVLHSGELVSAELLKPRHP